MSITVRKLNADTTFLLTFSAAEERTEFTILFDPWLQGQSSWIHPAIQASDHTIEPAVATLAELEHKVDLILVSQDKPDHCHRPTLCSWPKEKQVKVLAAPSAARKIREWKHFDKESIIDMPPYIAGVEDSLTKIDTGHGQLSIANLASKKDLTGLHNAIAIVLRSRDVVRQTSNITPPESPPLATSPVQRSGSRQTLRNRVRSFGTLRSGNRRARPHVAAAHSSKDCVSCIFSPHGVSTALIQSYLQNELEPLKALPLTLLMHGMNMEQNPWYMGGIVANGAPGGINLIKALDGRVQNWVSAHDEAKDNRGFSVKLLKTHKFGMEDIRELLDNQHFDQVQLRAIEPGQSLYLSG